MLTPGWVLVHLLAWSAAVAMVELGRWQLRVSDAKHFDLQNFGYTVQWWAFSAFALLLWARVVRDTWRGRPAPDTSSGGELVLRGRPDDLAPVGAVELRAAPAGPGHTPAIYRGYRMPQSGTNPIRSAGDPMHGAYNDYLWQLALADADASGSAAAHTDPPAASRTPGSSCRRAAETPLPAGPVTGPGD